MMKNLVNNRPIGFTISKEEPISNLVGILNKDASRIKPSHEKRIQY